MYCGYICKIENLRKHSNADRLQVGTCYDNNVIVSLDIQDGDMGVYFPTDGKLGMEFCIANNLLRTRDENGKQTGGYLDPSKRNIVSLKLRGETSDGLWMPLKSLETFVNINSLNDGDEITILNNTVICEKYIPNIERKKSSSVSSGQKKTKKTNSYLFFKEHIDTAQLAYNRHQFQPGDVCYITLKMHGTSGRTSYAIESYEKKQTLLDKILKRKSILKRWNVVSGTRRVVLNFNDNNKGYYDDNDFRKKWHDYIAPQLHKGETIYYEIVGYVHNDTLIMPQGMNKKVNDKNFIKQYGEITTFNYGCEIGQNNVYVYRMNITNEDGYIVEYSQDLIKSRCEEMNLNMVPELDRFIYTTDEDLMQRVEKYYDGTDPIGKTHIREGVVLRIENSKTFKAFKHKNIWFKILEGIIKTDANAPDMEEIQEI